PEDWLKDMQRYIIASQINVAPGAGKNWRCNNLSDNLEVATLTAVRGLAAGNGGGQIGALNTAGEFQGKAAAEIGRIGAGIATVEHLKQTAVFGQLMQGDMSVEQFSA
ncbi:12653_t:CDS:2, partial [Rhizophagus irregularis]